MINKSNIKQLSFKEFDHGLSGMGLAADRLSQLDFMHKSIITAMHEIAALVAKRVCSRWVGTFLPSVRIVRPENKVTIVPRAQ